MMARITRPMTKSERIQYRVREFFSDLGYRWSIFVMDLRSRLKLPFRRLFFGKVMRWCGYKMGMVMPWYLIVAGCVLFPSRGLQILCEKIAPVGYDLCRDAFKVDGIYFDRWMLVDLAGFPEGTLFRVVKREGKTITIERIKLPTDPAKDTADWIDSDVLLNILKEAGAKLDDQPIPLIGRYYWNPTTRKIEPIAEVK